MIQSRSDATAINQTPDLTPLLDIIFIVMVFLLLTANITVKTLTLDVPSTEHSDVLQTQNEQVIAISLLADNNLSAQGNGWAIEEMHYPDFDGFSKTLLGLHKKFPERPVVIASDKLVSVERMLQLLAFMQKNNINATNIIMDEQT
ncbi:biopolymer transporter ExbD [Psychromonas marina]|uniref:Biopolymer transporter ExbD n=1 Tax=Psychromonas marina TaxID=88364 RepID=A0ABQ6E0W1_9GAMM|nr:biopolymer transporter ExbD [Psychromonas marina]GLS91069.1 biopolymer transporter ExbD [Psychromonas marina]